MSASTADQPFLSIDGVSAGYGPDQAVLQDLYLRVDSPALVLVEGENGAGKSTLVEVVSGYLAPRSGSITIRGVEAASPAAASIRRICRTEPSLYPVMTVRDHITFASRWVGIAPGEGELRATRYGLLPWFNTPAGSLSTGNRRKLWLLMCTLGDVDLVMLDEPFNGLDAEGIRLLSGELADWARTRAVLLVAHRPPAGLNIHQCFRLERVKNNPEM